MREKFVEPKFRKDTLKLIETANTIINEMAAQGYTLTVRQLYYQFVARDIIPNTQNDYKRLASTIDNARKAGLIDWDAIEDRTRYLREITTFATPQQFLQYQTEHYYAEALWRDQSNYCEVWVEKDALLGVVERPCLEWRVPYFACRGYASSSELYSAGKRLARKLRQGKRVTVFHLGDHDPSGCNMSEVNRDTLHTFARSINIDLQRIALNMDQVEEYNPPPNPAKESDSRFEEYQRIHGDDCWELDALDPSVIDATIRTAIESVVDKTLFDARSAEEDANKDMLQNIVTNWPQVQRYLKLRDELADVEGWSRATAEGILDVVDGVETDTDE